MCYIVVLQVKAECYQPLTEQWDIPGEKSSESIAPKKSQPHSSASFTLQEAFLRKKLEFIKNSRDRMSNLKVNALKRQQAAKVQGSFGNKGALRSSYSYSVPRGKGPKAPDGRSSSMPTGGSAKGAREERECLVVQHPTNSTRDRPSTSTHHEG